MRHALGVLAFLGQRVVEVRVDRDRRDRLGQGLLVRSGLSGSAPRRANARRSDHLHGAEDLRERRRRGDALLVDPLLSAHRLGLLARATARDFLAGALSHDLAVLEFGGATSGADPLVVELLNGVLQRLLRLGGQVAGRRDRVEHGGVGVQVVEQAALEAQDVARPRCHRGSP